MDRQEIKHTNILSSNPNNVSLGNWLSLALEAGEMATWTWNFILNQGFWSEKLCTLFEYTATQPVSESMFFDKIHDDYRGDIRKALVNAIAKRQKNTVVEYPIVLESGRLRWIEQRAVLRYSSGGEVQEAIGLCWDTTDKKNQELHLKQSIQRLEKLKNLLHVSEKKLRTILNSTNARVLMLNKDNKVLMANRACYEMMGLQIHEVVGQEIIKLLGDKNWLKFEPYFELCFKTGNPISFETNLRFSHQFSDIYLRVSLHPELGNTGRVESVLATILDVTEQKNLEFSLRNAKNYAERASQHKSEFLSRMSHEMRTPLHAIMAFTDMLSKSSMDPVQKGHIDTMLKSEQHLLGLINDVLSLSQIEAGKLVLNESPFQFPKMVEDCLANFMVDPDEKFVEIVKRIDWPTEFNLLGDEQRLRQILMNLVSNAVKFTKKGTIEVGLRGTAIESRMQIEMWVQDTGPGIETDRLSRIFESFYRLDFHSDVPGTGLGLAICKGIIEKMQGEIKVESTVGKGTVFTCYVDLPIVEDAKQSRQQKTVKPEADFFTKIKKILIVDDDPINRKIMRSYFQNRDLLRLDYAEDGLEAIQQIEKHFHSPYDLVLMDMRMPRMDGYQCTTKIREFENRFNLRKKAIIVALSASSLKEEVRRSLASGCNEHLSKPILYTDLIKKIENIL